MSNLDNERDMWADIVRGDNERATAERARLDALWADAPTSARHHLSDGRRAVLQWTERGTSLVLIDPAPRVRS